MSVILMGCYHITQQSTAIKKVYIILIHTYQLVKVICVFGIIFRQYIFGTMLPTVYVNLFFYPKLKNYNNKKSAKLSSNVFSQRVANYNRKYITKNLIHTDLILCFICNRSQLFLRSQFKYLQRLPYISNMQNMKYQQ